QEIVDGYKVIKTFNGEAYEVLRFSQEANNNRQQTMKLNLTKGISTPIIQFIASLAIAAVVFFAAGLIADKTLTPGQFITMLGLMMAVLKPIKVISNLNQIIQQGIVAAESVFEVIDADKENDSGTNKLNRTPQEIVFKDIDFYYPKSSVKILDKISFSVKKNTTVALVGR
ncbi:MAG: lipid ABC transporter permease/ATP-binding protein, partial [Lentisphaeria bacterium]|nr:lipid ABC transporter permease/ATP-binding protein [Lentisphaeria bacterium]